MTSLVLNPSYRRPEEIQNVRTMFVWIQFFKVPATSRRLVQPNFVFIILSFVAFVDVSRRCWRLSADRNLDPYDLDPSTVLADYSKLYMRKNSPLSESMSNIPHLKCIFCHCFLTGQRQNTRTKMWWFANRYAISAIAEYFRILLT